MDLSNQQRLRFGRIPRHSSRSTHSSDPRLGARWAGFNPFRQQESRPLSVDGPQLFPPSPPRRPRKCPHRLREAASRSRRRLNADHHSAARVRPENQRSGARIGFVGPGFCARPRVAIHVCLSGQHETSTTVASEGVGNLAARRRASPGTYAALDPRHRHGERGRRPVGNLAVGSVRAQREARAIVAKRLRRPEHLQTNSEPPRRGKS